MFSISNALSPISDKYCGILFVAEHPTGSPNIKKENETMKRKFLCLLLALTMVLGLAATVSAAEEIITSGDWTYRAYGEEAVLCSYNGTATEITVPATIDGLPVTELGWVSAPASPAWPTP